ncbi:unnamed protein product, partial [Ectocarpus sp. 8 AP-2014]
MQRLVSKPEECGGTRQDWLDCLREMVEAHKLSRKPRPTPPPPPSRLREYEGDGRRGGGGEPSFPPLFAAARTSASLPAGSPAVSTADAGGGARAAATTPAVPPAHTRTRSGSSSSSVSGSGSAYSGGQPHDEAFPCLPSQYIGQRPSRSPATASSLGNGQRSAAAGGGGRGDGGGLPRGRELRRLAKKIGALLRDYSPSSSLEAFEVEEVRLRLWVAANIMRSRALSKATRSGARPLLFLSSKGIPNRHEIVRAFSESAGTSNGGRDGDSTSCGGGGGGGGSSNGGSSGGGDDGDRGRTGRWRRGGRTATAGAGRAAAAAAAVRRRRLDELDERSRRRGRRWLLTLARFMARPREFELRRAAAVRAFTPQKFRQEWELFWELVDPVFDGLQKTTK